MLLRAGFLFACNALWRATGFKPAGRVLVSTLGSSQEDLQTLAGMFLVQAGERAEPLLEEALARRWHLPMVLTILGDLGNPRLEQEIERFADDSDPDARRAAREALRVLGRRAPAPSGRTDSPRP